MKKLLLMLVISGAPLYGMQAAAVDPVKAFCVEIQPINFNNLVKAEDIKKTSAAVGKLLGTNNSRSVFLVPSASKLVGLALSFIESDVCSKKAPEQGMWGAGALRASYHDLLKFRKEIIDLLEDNKSLTWQERFASNQAQVDELLTFINQLRIPESTWGNWARSFLSRGGESFAQWDKSYVGTGEPGQPISPFDKYLTEVYAFASDAQKDPVLRAVAHIYRLSTQLLQYMIREKYKFKSPLVTKGQMAIAATGAALLTGAYVCGRYGGAQPVNE